MNKKFTKLMAALALLTFLAAPMGMRGQETRDTKTDIMFAKGFAGYTSNSFSAVGTDRSAVANSTNATGVTYAMQVFNGSTGAVRGNQSGANNYSCRNTTSYEGYYISSVSLTVSGGTLDGSTNGRSVVYFGSSAYADPNTTAPSGTATSASPSSSNQATLTWTNTDENVSHFILYNLKTSNTAVSANANTPLTVVWTQKTQSSVATPVLSLGTGTYAGTQSVEITCATSEADIYYTLDGTTPSANSTLYTGAVSITESKTLKAIAIKDNESSAVVTATYTILTPLTTMQEIFDAASSTSTQVAITFNNYVITGKNSGNNSNKAYLTDGTKGCIIYESGHGFTAGDVLNGTVVCNLVLYGNAAELTGLKHNTYGLTVTTGGSVTPVVTTVDMLAAVNTGSVVTLNGLTYNGTTTLRDSNNNPVVLSNTIYTASLTSGKTYNITGVFEVNYSNKRINPRSATDIVEATNPTISIDPATAAPFTYVEDNGPSTDQMFEVSGTNLTSTNIVATITTGVEYFEITDDETYSSTVTVNSGGIISVRMKVGLALGNYAGTLTLTNEGAENVVVALSGSVTGQTYSIELDDQVVNGTIAADMTSAPAGAIVTLTATPDAGYELVEWTVIDGEANDVTVTNNQFEMPASDVLVSATFTAKPTYTITTAVTPTDGGTVVTLENAYEGQNVGVEVEAQTGFTFISLVVSKTDDATTTVETTGNLADGFTFTMPGYAVTVTATFLSNNFIGDFVKHETVLVEGDYLIVYEGGAMNNTNSSKRFGYEDVTPENDIISNPSNDIVWHIAPSTTDGYWTLYNAKVGKYAGSVGTSSDMSLESSNTEDKVLWSTSGAYEFRNKINEGNTTRYLRRNGTYGFANYATSTGGSLTLYKYTVLTERTITFNGNGGTYNSETTYTQTVYDGIAANLTANQFTKANANFIGWATTENGEVEYADEAEITATADITLYAQWETVHTLTCNSSNAIVFVFVNDSYEPIEFVNNQAQILEGATVYVSIEPMECYLFSNLSVTYGDNQTVPATEEEPNVYYSFTMPTDDATLTVTTTAKPVHMLTVGALSHVTLELTAGEESYEVQSGEELCEGIHVTVVATPDDGYVMGSVSVVYGNNQSVEVTTEGPNTYSFYMPTGDATISVAVEEYVAPLGGTITFGKAEGSTQIKGASSSGTGTVTYTDTGDDSNGNAWTITTVTSNNKFFTQDGSYSQVGSSSNPVNSITFTTTFSEPVIITNFQAKFGGFGGTAGTITLKVGETTVGTGSLNGTSDVVVNNTLVASGTTLTVTVTDIDKGVKCYYISYEYLEPLHINGHSGGAGGWYLIASPVTELTPSMANGFLTDNYGSSIPEGESGTYDLYYFDQTGGDNGKEWKNYRQHTFNLESGKGYLYASKEGTDLVFTGTAYNGNGVVNLTYSELETTDDNMRGWNLIGNPFGTTANLPSGLSYYTLNESRTELTPGSATTIGAMKAIFVKATATGQSVTFTKQTRNAGSNAILSLNLSSDNNGLIDRAIVRFDEGNALPKFMLDPNNTKVFIPVESKDYAVVRHEAQGEMPVSFRAAENGTYTLTVNPEGVEMNYLHLIDNMTGMDVDLLQTPSYTFDARTTDYSSRFRLVFSANGTSAGSATDNFAFYSNGTWIISNDGEATLQVVDVMGRMLSSEIVNGSVSKAINATAGVYMLRLINGNDVKTQKIVVR